MHSLSEVKLSSEDLSRLQRCEHKYLMRMMVFIALYCLGAFFAVQVHLLGVSWVLALPCYLLAGASLHGVSLFTHEAVHGLLHPNKKLNQLLGSLAAWPVLQTCSAYRVLHLKHHACLGAVGDPDHYRNYNHRKKGVFILHWGRLLLGYPAYLVAIPFLALRQGNVHERRDICAELFCFSLVLVGLFSLNPPVLWVVHGWLLPMCFIHFMVNIRGMSQHTLLEHVESQVMGTRTIITTPLVRFFMCNENFHLEHHIHPEIPWYHLDEAHRLLLPQLEEVKAPLIATYTTFVVDFIRTSLTKEQAGTVDIKNL